MVKTMSVVIKMHLTKVGVILLALYSFVLSAIRYPLSAIRYPLSANF